MGRKLLEIAYLGTNYCGWQVQPNGVTVQYVLQNALEALLHFRPNVTGCSRTDSGVHAESFFCHFDIESDIPNQGIVLGLNTKLPKDIAAINCYDVPDDFHARYDALGKTYRYRMYHSNIRDPFLADRTLIIKQPIDLMRAKEYCGILLGCHDFAAFSSIHRTVENTVRTVSECYVTKNENNYEFVVRADGFLYNMVRIMVGGLLDYSAGRLTAKDLQNAFESKERSCLGATAPALGLSLSRVHYSEHIFKK